MHTYFFSKVNRFSHEQDNFSYHLSKSLHALSHRKDFLKNTKFELVKYRSKKQKPEKLYKHFFSKNLKYNLK